MDEGEADCALLYREENSLGRDPNERLRRRQCHGQRLEPLTQ
ncbi:hypothetical protein [Diaphorobacter caeni]|nr:hypothetical protein [Diaphorobacter caeni]